MVYHAPGKYCYNVYHTNYYVQSIALKFPSVVHLMLGLLVCQRTTMRYIRSSLE